MLCYIFTATEKRHGAQRLQTIVADSNCDLGKFIVDGNLNRWLEANVSCCGVAVVRDFHSVLLQKWTDKVRRGARGIVDVIASIKQMLTEKKPLDVIMNYIHVSSHRFLPLPQPSN
jgi:hypothetical protein